MEVETFEENGYTVTIETDEDPPNPREWDNLGTMCMRHSRYNLPWEFDGVWQVRPTMAIVDRSYFTGQFTRYEVDCANWTDVATAIRQSLQDDGDDLALVVPVYMLDHGGTYFSVPRERGFVLDPFRHLYMGWDSMMVGIIFISHKKACEEYGWKHITEKRKQRLWDYLAAEVEDYNQYSSGDVYCFTVEDEDGEEIEFDRGYFGLDAVREAAKEVCYAGH